MQAKGRELKCWLKLLAYHDVVDAVDDEIIYGIKKCLLQLS